MHIVFRLIYLFFSKERRERMKDFYIDCIREKRDSHKDLYEQLVMRTFGKQLSWEDFQLQNEEALIGFMCELEQQINIEESVLDVKKLARSIQHSRSGGGLAAITSFTCAFCGRTETWSSTAVPNLCLSCATDMAVNMAAHQMDILKERR